MWEKNYSGAVVIVAVALLLLVPLLAYLQFLWVGQLSERELERMQNNLRMTAFNFSIDVTEELMNGMRAFDVRLAGPEDRIARECADRLTRWKATAACPAVIGEIYLLQTGPRREGRVLRKLDVSSERFAEAPWPRDSAEWLSDPHNRNVWLESEFSPSNSFFVLRSLGAFALPARGPAGVDAWDGRARPAYDPASPRLIVMLQWDVIKNTVLPALVTKYHSSADNLDIEFTIVDRRDASRILWTSATSAASTVLPTFDVSAPIGSIPPFLGRERPPAFSMRANPGPPPDEKSPAAERGGEFRRRGPGEGRERGMERNGMYELRIRHRAGSLEAVVRQNRIRNLGVSFGILVLLAGSVLILLFAAHRSQQLAFQEIEFVAGVSHELRTPLAVVNSVGENLADGVVTGKDRTREYGRLITGEVGRLSGIVENALEYAGIRSGRRKYDMQPSAPASILKKALRECEGMRTQAGMTVELSIAEDCPNIMADPQALQVALRNILVNALKYGREGGWIGVRLSSEERRGSLVVVMAVADRGIGIEADDLKKVFRAFYRGRNTYDVQVHGSGLGLSLAQHIVRAHKGQIDVDSAPGKGSTFTIILPALVPSSQENVLWQKKGNASS